MALAFRNESVATDEYPPMSHGVGAVVAIALTTAVLVLFTVVGNALVICAVFVVRKLRQPPNYLLVSLAAADMLVGLLVMPFACLHHIYGRWTLGTAMCNFWTCLDVLLCTASILNLCAISVDRYWAITCPLTYGPKRTARRVLYYIMVVWILAFLVSVVPLVALYHMTDSSPNNDCQVDQSIVYQIYATLCAFYIPVLIMVIVNIKIFAAARRLALKDQRSCDLAGSSALLATAAQNAAAAAAAAKFPNSDSNQRLASKGIVSHIRKRFSSLSDCSQSRNLAPNRENKAARTLSIIMGAFITCWLPFFLLALIKPLCGRDCPVPSWLDALIQWAGYCNSSLNPVLYATFNRDFRIPFREILCCRCATLQSVLRNEIYAEIYGDGVATSPSHCADLIATNSNHHRHSRASLVLSTADTITSPISAKTEF